MLTGWGRVAPSRSEVVETGAEGLRRLLEAPPARGLIARGLGRSYGDAAQNAGGVTARLTGLAELRDFDRSTGRITVGAGLSLGELIDHVLPAGWFPAVTPGTRHVTVGGAIACDVHGKNHHRVGGFCDHVAWLDLLTPAKELVRLSPEQRPEAFRATAGGMGATGFVLSARLRLRPVTTSYVREVVRRTGDLDETLSELQRAEAAHEYSVAWIDCLARGRSAGRSVVSHGDHADVEQLPPGSAARPLESRWPRTVSVPHRVPPGLVNAGSVRAFNALWSRRFAKARRERLVSLPRFFYPLDAVGGWNRLYGDRGMIQYQVAVPSGAADTVGVVLDRLRAARLPAALAVLKRLGPGGGMLSFPCEGWTLAVDVPAQASGLGPALNALDRELAGVGGRVYLAKDVRLARESLPGMYAELSRWREEQARLDPAGVMRSDLLRRLGLVPA